jgi:hypothetical protein
MSSTQFNYEEEHQKYRVEHCFDEFELLDPRHFGYYIDEEMWRDPQTGKYFNGNLEEVFPEPDPEALFFGLDEEEEDIPDPEADTEDEEEIFDPEATDTEDEEEEESVYKSLQKYREYKKKVLDSFELLKADEHPYDYDLYRDIESGRVFDLDGEEYFQQNQ